MEAYEDDDDTHFCIKCHVTIHGLENYVRHRQSGCHPPHDGKSDTVHESPSTPTTVSYPEILNADAFFSSLELQSSAKTNSRRTTNLLVSGRKFKKDDKRKKTTKTQVDTDESMTKEKLHSMLPGVADLDDPTEHLCIPSLVGFPDIVTSTASKPSLGAVPNKLDQPHTSTAVDSATFRIKHEADCLDSLITVSKLPDRKRHDDTQRMEQDHQTWLEDTILADLVENNDGKDLARYEFEYQQDEESEDDTLDEDLGDEESYSDSDDGDDQEGPPRGHTGGKWKPDLDDLPQLHDDDVDPEEEHQAHPPPTYTGGKWRPSDTSQKSEDYESKGTVEQPPPGHTRGKWVPGAQVDIDRGYWCNPCGRRLASRLVYNRHLLSDLHSRRSMQEIDGIIHLPRTANTHPTRKSSTRRRPVSKIMEEAEEKDTKKIVRKREKDVLTCEMCHTRVRRPQMGKHLISHYHCRVAGVNPVNRSAQRFLLENMANVVRQCPFQCSSCRFYCNTEETFLFHWRSALHINTLKQIGGSYRCASCDFWCDDNELMETHLLSTHHRDVVSMMNGSVPVVISRQRPLPCNDCGRQFRYNLQLRLHARETGHEEAFTASDEYQQRFGCNLCPQVLRSLISLQRHQLSCHVAKEEQKDKPSSSTHTAPYFCSFCSMNFATPQEAVLHRRTSSHKEMVKARKYSEGVPQTMVRKCPHCGEKQPNLAEHKEHLLRVHPELCHRCPQCGTLFALSQDVTRHTKEKYCCKDNELSTSKISVIKEEWNCSSCTFSTDSQAEFIFHEALHIGRVESEEGEPSSSERKYRCPICQKVFFKVSLRNHIRIHTGERPFPCAKCFASFARRSELNAHQRKCVSSSSEWSDETDRRRSFICSECNNAFYTKHALRQHMLRHAGKSYKCGLPGCPTVLRTASELKSHRMIVHDSGALDRRYSCSDCSYAAKTKTQLRRHRAKHEDPTSESVVYFSCPYEGCSFKTKLASHLRRHSRLHTGTKPYKCRHCAYASNNLENLRKHVLSTNLHPGKTIYECDFCMAKNMEPYCTNFAKELRAHLLEIHPDNFPMPDYATNYVLSIFEADRCTLPNETTT